MTRHQARHIVALLTNAIRGAAAPGMSRDIGLTLIFKLAALGVLWALFFSDAHQPSADPAATSRRLALTPSDIRTSPHPKNTLQERSRD